jgi:hypothetical protein
LIPTRSRFAAATLMLAFTVAILVALSVHPRTSTVDAATMAPVTQPAHRDTLSSASEPTSAPTTTAAAVAYAAKAYVTPTTVAWTVPPTTAAWVAPTTTAKPVASTTTSTYPWPKPAAAPSTTAAPVYVPPPTTAPSGGGSSSDMAFLACVRQRESGGNYGAVNAGGYYGAYQFSISTWNGTASYAGRGDLVGVRPDHASPGDQDAMALTLLRWQGRGPWGGYC